MNLIEEIKKIIKGDAAANEETLTKYSHDAGLFEVRPKVVVFPKDVEDVKNLVRFADEKKSDDPTLSLTARSAGSGMSGGSLNESIILDFTKYFTHDDVDVENLMATVEPGVYYRDFEKETLPEKISLPPYPASKTIAALGGMVMNNCGGERTLRYGQIRNFVEELNMVLSDGNEYTFRKLDKAELESKMAQNDFEGDLYKRTYNLLEENYDKIKSAKPKVSKNSAGYALWDVWDKETFDLTQLFTGSQGTLGILTKARLRLIKDKTKKKMMVIFFKDWDILPNIVNSILPSEPETLEVFDDETLKLGIKFMPQIAKIAGSNLVSFALKFLPEAIIGIKMLGLPKLILLVEFSEDSEKEVDDKIQRTTEALSKFPIHKRILESSDEQEKYWIMRRQSFALLRKSVKGKRTAPFVDDFCINPDRVPEFLPKMLAILKENGIKANIAGHAGNGNFHIIPLMDISKKEERDKIFKISDKVYDLIIEYGGTITGEHNDGIVRTPYLKKMYGSEVYSLFEQVKNIFDPKNIFNPGKKVGGTVEYAASHIVKTMKK